MNDWLSEYKLEELIMEGAKRYLYHPDGCDKAGSLTLEELHHLSKRMARVLRESIALMRHKGLVEEICEELYRHGNLATFHLSEDLKALCVAARDESRE